MRSEKHVATLLIRAILGALLCGAVIGAPACASADEVPYIQTPSNVVDAMLAIADVGPKDYVVDLGSGDGRIVIAAAQRNGARGLGIDYDPSLIAEKLLLTRLKVTSSTNR